MLVADDDRVGCRMVERLVNLAGCEAITCPDGNRAMEVFESAEPPEVAIRTIRRTSPRSTPASMVEVVTQEMDKPLCKADSAEIRNSRAILP